MEEKRRKKEPSAEKQSVWKPIRFKPPPVQPEFLHFTPQPPVIIVSDLPGFFLQEDLPLSRKGYKYEPCVANKFLPSVLYSNCEVEPFSAGVNYYDLSPFVAIGGDNRTITTAEGYRGARANVKISEGSWYFEIVVVKANEPGSDASVRIGLARREASLEAPVGADGYGYGLQSIKGRKVHLSRPAEFMEPFGSGDVIGFHVEIPRTKVMHANARRDRYPVVYKGSIYYEVLDYVPSKEMDGLLLPKMAGEPKQNEIIPGSKIIVYKNGELVGPMFENLREFLPPFSQYDLRHHVPPFDDGMAGYYPMISVYRGGQAKFNFGPEFVGQLPEKSRPLCEAYDEQIADNITLDILDEVEFEEVDASVTPRTVTESPTVTPAP